ncbi:MAG: hypothetical protein WCD86_09425 [Ktedonobacteraceae bacterium]
MFSTTLSHVARSRVRLISPPKSTLADDQLPPPGYAVAILPDGCAAPLGIVPYQRADNEDAQDVQPFGVYTLDWQFEAVPPASGRWPRAGIITFPTYRDACLWCQRRWENAHLLSLCQKQTSGVECYPERSAWYRYETERLLRETGYHWSGGNPDGPFFLIVYATEVSLWVNASSPYLPTLCLHVLADDCDEVWKQVYAAVAKFCGKSRREASFATSSSFPTG